VYLLNVRMKTDKNNYKKVEQNVDCLQFETESGCPLKLWMIKNVRILQLKNGEPGCCILCLKITKKPLVIAINWLQVPLHFKTLQDTVIQLGFGMNSYLCKLLGIPPPLFFLLNLY